MFRGSTVSDKDRSFSLAVSWRYLSRFFSFQRRFISGGEMSGANASGSTSESGGVGSVSVSLGVGSLEALVSQTLDDYFVPKANVPFERHMFLQIAQEISETVDQFVCRLRQRAVSRDFGARASVIEKTTIFEIMS